MNTFNVNEVAFNLTLFKRLGCYQIFSPNSPKIFNYNAYRLGPVVIIVTTICCVIYGSMGFLVKMDDVVEDTKLLQIIFIYLNYYLSVFKLYMCIRNANEIWDLLDVTRIDFMTSEQCSKYMGVLHAYRYSSIKITNFLSAFITATLLAWWTFPMLVNYVFSSKPDGETRPRRLENVNNFRYPLSVETYNDNFYLLYFIEAVSGIVIEYGILIVDVLLISISYVFIAQYEIHKMAFANIGHEPQLPANRHDVGNENDRIDYYEDFKSIVIEQQKLNLKLKSYYSIVWPIITATVAVTSGSIILLAYSSVMKNTVAFGIYSCNWTAMNLKFKKLVLFTIHMNDANKLMMNFTPQKTVNLQFFANVMVTCYNTVSVILRTRMQSNNVSD